jgi:hypothetical protein
MQIFYYKKSFSIIEMIFVITIISIIISLSNPKTNIQKIKLAKQQLILHLKYMRYIAMLDNKYKHDDKLWYRKAWNMKFLKCDNKIGGIYYVIYENIFNTEYWAVSKNETLIDPLTNNHIYSFQCEKDNLYDKSKFVLLSEYYGIKDIKISCSRTPLGQILFLNSGSAYSKFKNQMEKFKIKKRCILTLIDKQNNKEYINIEANTGFIF